MSASSFSCPACGGPIEDADPRSPIIKCRYCGTTMQNPFYRDEGSSSRIAMPVININVGSVQAEQSAAPATRTESTKTWLTTLFLALFFGMCGTHRFYTGHVVIGIVQFVTLGMGGLWTLVDLFLIVTDSFRDKDGLRLSGKRISKFVVLGAIGLMCFACVGLIVIGENASKEDIPADHGWITGIDRCAGSASYGDVVLEDTITIWKSWGDDLGSIIGTVKHGDYVRVLEGRHDSSQDRTYYKIETDSGLRGWVSEIYIQFQPLDEGTVPRADC